MWLFRQDKLNCVPSVARPSADSRGVHVPAHVSTRRVPFQRRIVRRLPAPAPTRGHQGDDAAPSGDCPGDTPRYRPHGRPLSPCFLPRGHGSRVNVPLPASLRYLNCLPKNQEPFAPLRPRPPGEFPALSSSVFASSNGAHYGAEITPKVPTMVTYQVPRNGSSRYRTVPTFIKTTSGPFVRCVAKKREKPRGIGAFWCVTLGIVSTC